MSKAHKFLSSIVVALTLHVVTIGQTSAQNDPNDWVRIESPSKEFSFSAPSMDFLVDNEDGAYRTMYQKKGISLNVSVEKTRDAKGRIARSSRSFTDPKYQSFKSGDFIGWWYTDYSEKNKTRSYWFWIASSKELYTVSLHSDQVNEELAARLLRSVRLDGKQIVNVANTDPPAARTVAIDSLQTSDIVKVALSQPDAKHLKLERMDPKASDLPIRDLSRNFIVLRRPKGTYTQSARERGINGSVQLKIYFLANGTIGAIKLVKSLDPDLDRRAFEAAKQIKFIPAEMDGKPVDFVATFEYSFNIYY